MQNSLYNIQRSRSQLDSIQEKIASGRNYNRPSDDPVSARLLVGFGDRLRTTEQYQSNINKANVWLKMTDTALTGLANTMYEIKRLTATITSGTDDLTFRQNTVTQLTNLRQQLADIGNTQLEDRYIFAGTATDTKPYDRNVQVPPVAATYLGNDTTSSIEIDTNSIESLNIPGDQVLGSDTNGVNILYELDRLIAAIEANDVPAIRAQANQMESGAQQLQRAQVINATRISRLDTTSKMLANTKNTLETVIGNIQTADYAKLAVEMTQQQTAFEATLSSTARISQVSLLDYL
jgi:flagellar hook-associated protein 3 FlgL